MKIKLRMEEITLILAIVIFLFGIIFFRHDIGLIGNFIIFSMLIILIPRSLKTFFYFQKIKKMEEIFPVFLQDLAEWQKAGLTLHEALKNASKIDYGKLTEEIKKIHIQLSWGIPLQEALRNFSERVKDSEIIRKAVEIIIESYQSGGNLEETMDSLAKNLSLIKEMHKERKTIMSQHVATMYIIYFIFLGISLGLLKSVLPIAAMELFTGEFGGVKGQGKFICDVCSGLSCLPCTVFLGISKILALGEGVAGYYKGLFFSMLLIQGIFTGLICGQITENSLKAGIRHSLILALIGLGIFMIAVRVGGI